MIEAYAIGAAVKVGGPDNPIDARINAICIRAGGYVTYEIVWWEGRSRRSEWLTADEFTLAHPPGRSTRIGFGIEE